MNINERYEGFYNRRSVAGLVMLPLHIFIGLSLVGFGPSSPLGWIALYVLGLWLMSLLYNAAIITKVGVLKRFSRTSICLVIFSGPIVGILLAYILIP